MENHDNNAVGHCANVACLTVGEKFMYAVCLVLSSSMQSPWQETLDLGYLSKVPVPVRKHPLMLFQKKPSNEMAFPARGK